MKRLIHFMVAFAVALPLFGGVTWDELSPKVMNKTVVVEDNTGSKHRGELRELNAEGLAIRMKNGERVPFRRADVKRIQVKSRARGALWGAAIGAGVGGAAGGSLYRSFENEGNSGPEILGICLGLFTGAGAGIGFAAGAMETVYKAPREESAAVSTRPLSETWRPYGFREGNRTTKAPSNSGKARTAEAEVPTYLAAER